MAQRPVFRLAEAVLLFLFLLLPMMLLLGAAEGTARRPTLLFWVFWLLPFLVLPVAVEPSESRRKSRTASDRRWRQRRR